MAPSAFLASAASTFNLQNRILLKNLTFIPDTSVTDTLAIWNELSNNQIVNESQKITQKAWDDKVTEIQFKKLLDNATLPEGEARLLAVKESRAGLNAMPILAISLRLSGNAIRISIGLRLGSNLCESYVCTCAKFVNAKGLHSFSCKRSSGKIARHGLLNDVILRAIQSAKIPAKKETLGLRRTDGKRPDGVTVIPWSKRKCFTRDVTVPDTFATSHVNDTSLKAGAAADKASTSKTAKYANLCQSHIFMPITVKTSGAFNKQSYDFIADLGPENFVYN